MKAKSVTEVSRSAGISVRTLHHYDQVGLLKPETRSEAGYRLYGEKELLRLQQILFYRELELSLQEIKEILDDPDFDIVQALESHKKALRKKQLRLKKLLDTIDKTIVKLKKEEKMLSFDDLYEGFPKEKAKAYDKEASERWPSAYAESRDKLQKMSKKEWKEIQGKGDYIMKLLAETMGLPVSHKMVQDAIAQHYQWINLHFNCSLDVYMKLGQMYVEDERFTATFDKYKPGLAKFVNEAIQYYCKSQV